MLSLSLYVYIEELEEGGLKNVASKAWRLGISFDMWPDWPVAQCLRRQIVNYDSYCMLSLSL